MARAPGRTAQARTAQAHRPWLSCNGDHGSRLAAQRSLHVSSAPRSDVCLEILPFKRRRSMTPPVNSPAIKVVKSVREQVSAEEWQTRVDLAACYRLTAMYGMTEMIANHISCRVPGSHDHFLINPYGMLYEEIDASCLIKVDIDGNVLFNASDYGVNAAGFVIHSAIHMARHDVDCVAHTHTPAGMAVSAMECGLLPLAPTSMRFLPIAYHDFDGIADDVGERQRLVKDLGDHEAMVW